MGRKAGESFRRCENSAGECGTHRLNVRDGIDDPYHDEQAL